jgi:hypothetical protein
MSGPCGQSIADDLRVARLLSGASLVCRLLKEPTGRRQNDTVKPLHAPRSWPSRLADYTLLHYLKYQGILSEPLSAETSSAESHYDATVSRVSAAHMSSPYSPTASWLTDSGYRRCQVMRARRSPPELRPTRIFVRPSRPTRCVRGNPPSLWHHTEGGGGVDPQHCSITAREARLLSGLVRPIRSGRSAAPPFSQVSNTALPAHCCRLGSLRSRKPTRYMCQPPRHDPWSPLADEGNRRKALRPREALAASRSAPSSSLFSGVGRRFGIAPSGRRQQPCLPSCRCMAGHEPSVSPLHDRMVGADHASTVSCSFKHAGLALRCTHHPPESHATVGPPACRVKQIERQGPQLEPQRSGRLKVHVACCHMQSGQASRSDDGEV